MLSVLEVAETLNCSEQYVRKLIREGKIDAERVGKTWLIHQTTIDNFNLKDIKLNKPGIVQDRVSTRKYSKSKLNVLSFFSGAMGLDIGLEKAGLNVLLACEIDNPSRKTIVANDKEVGLIGDIRLYNVEDILRHSNLKSKDQVDVIVGGPPCQAFSTAGKRMGFQDDRGNVFLKYIDLITEIKPKYAVLENVRGLMSTPMSIDLNDKITKKFDFDPKEFTGSSLYYVKKRLEDAGYKISFNLYNSANFGVPQIRERVVIICTLMDTTVPYLTPSNSDNATYGLPKWITFKEAVKNIDKKNCDHINFSAKRLKYIEMLKPGQNWRDLPEKIQKEAMGNSFLLGGGKTGFYRRLSWDKPSPTLVTHPAMPATELAHPTINRPLSIQEYKKVQQFPDEWSIEGNIIDQYKQIGNAVPVGLGYAIGIAILNHYNKKSPVVYDGFSFSRYKNTSDKEWESDFIAQVKKAKTKLNQGILEFAF